MFLSVTELHNLWLVSTETNTELNEKCDDAICLTETDFALQFVLVTIKYSF